MAEWSLLDREWSPNQYDPFQYAPYNPYYQEKPPPQPMAQCLPPQAQPYLSPQSPRLTLLLSSPQHLSPPAALQYTSNTIVPKGDNPREIRNKAEKQRRDKLNQSISELASMVPPVVAASRKIDKTGVLRLTAHYLRAHQYVFGDSIGQSATEFNSTSMQALLGFLKGFLVTTTYKGLIVVVSQNVNEYLGYTELELLGQSIFNITHEDDRKLLRDQLMPRSQTLGPNGELLAPDDRDGRQRVAEALANEKRRFIVRFKKLGQRSEPTQYVTCHVEGSLRKSDRACRGYNRCCQMVRRARARGDNPCSSGNDIVFIGVVRPATETFITESGLESFRMEYRTRHSIDGEIIQCEQRIALVTGYMTHEVNGVNAMNFMHRDDVRWVIVALREMYDKHRLFGESCYRLMTKNGQFIYMRTRGRLDVDSATKAVTSFVCTNTLVEEEEGKQLIQMMKKKFALTVNNNEDTEEEQVHDNQSLPVEDPRQLEKVILHLVTNLPSPQTDENSESASPDHGESTARRLAIIPPRKERIVSAIEKIYNVIKTIPKDTKKTRESTDEKPIVIQGGIEPTARDTESQHFMQFPKIIKNALPIPQSRSSNSCMRTHQKPMPLPAPSSCSYSSANTSSHGQLEICDLTTGANSDIVPYSPVIPYEMKGENITGNRISYARQSQITYTDVSSTPNLVAVMGNPNPGTEEKYVFVAPHQTLKQSTNLQADSCAIMQPSTSSAGVKRPNYFKESSTINKKKITDMSNELNQADQISSSYSPDLENFFDEAILSTQIESAINSLEQAVDPTFPDFLISNEVQDILREIEDDSYE